MGKIISIVYPMIICFVVYKLSTPYSIEGFIGLLPYHKAYVFLSIFACMWVLMKLSLETIYKPIWKTKT